MKRLISLLLCALLIVPALAEDAPDFEPIPWDIKVSPNLPNPDCYLPNNGGYHDDSIDIQINVTYWTQDLQQVDAPGEGTTTVMSARVKLTDEPVPHGLREQVPVEAGAPRQRHDEALQRRHGHRR